jgi:hypothetical protein
VQVFDPQAIPVPAGHFIGGRLVTDAGRIPVRRPSDNRVHAELPLADAATVDAAVHDAWRAWRTSDWARRAPRERARVLRRWADLIEADARGLAPLEAVCFDTAGPRCRCLGRAIHGRGPALLCRIRRQAWWRRSRHPAGIGKDLGRQAVEANLRCKSVLIDFSEPR